MAHADRTDGETTLTGAGADSRGQAGVSVPACGIAVMAKASIPGRAKTRLVPPLTYEQAAALNTAFLQDVFDNILLAGTQATPHARIAAYAAYGPPGSEEFFRKNFPASVDLIPAWLPNFGDCLFAAIREILARGHRAAVVLNADSPNLPTALLNQTAELLAQPGDRAVLGPSSDGGYYLLGLKAAHRRMFEDIAWSTERVADQTRERAHDIGLAIHELPMWYDVDDVECLRRLHAELGRPADSRGTGADEPRPHRPGHTAALFEDLWPDGFDRRVAPRQVEGAAV
jgi:rSAM/selenodomain-associated transferase 1